MYNKKTEPEKILWGVCLIAAPALLFVSSFFWSKGHYGTTGGALVAFDMLFWIPSFMAFFSIIKPKAPVYAVWALPVAILGCLAGVNFGFADYFCAAFNIPHEKYLQTLSQYPLSSNLLLFQTGPLMPLSLLVAALVMARTKAVNLFTAMLICAGAIMFPVSRITRNETLAHICDILLFIPLAYIGIKMLAGNNSTVLGSAQLL